MDKKNRLPFQSLSAKNWQNLAVAATLALYLMQLWSERLRLFWFLGADFMAYWSAGYIANHWGYAQIYNLSLIEKTQHLMLFGNVLPKVHFPPLPMAYLPIFVLPFQVLALLPPAASFYLWTFLNLLAGVLYLVHFTKNIGRPGKKRILFLFVISFPFFESLFGGQINIFLLIFLGEFIRAMQNRKGIIAGLWLGALLLKPQTLIVILPALLVTRKIKPLLGAVIGAVFLAGVSLLMAGAEGISSLAKLWFGYANNIATSRPEAMGNWRMVGAFIDHFTNSNLGSVLAILAAAITILWALYLWLFAATPSGTGFVLLVTAAFAATGLATWHSHAHMAVILIPALLYLYLKNELPEKLFSLWVFLPPLLYLIGLIILVFVRDRFFQGILYGPAQLILNLTLLIWSTRELVRRKKGRTHASLA